MSGAARRIALTGADGWLGRATRAAFARRGVEVRPIVHRPRANATTVDLASPGALPVLEAAFRGCEVVVHAAARVHRPHEDDREREAMHAVNVLGTERALIAAERAGVRRFVYVSTIGVHGFDDERAYDEADTPAPKTAYGATKWLGECAVRSSPVSSRILRLATLVGRGDVANFGRMARAVARRTFVVPGDGRAVKSFLGLDDAAELLAASALATTLPHELLHLAHPSPISVADAADAFARAFRVPRPMRIPVAPMRDAAQLLDAVSGHLGRPTSMRRAVAALTTSSVVTTQRAFEAFPDHRFRDFTSLVSCYVPSLVGDDDGVASRSAFE